MQNLNFGKTQKFYSQCEMGSPLHEEMADITSSNFTSGIKKNHFKGNRGTFLFSNNCLLSMSLVNSGF